MNTTVDQRPSRTHFYAMLGVSLLVGLFSGALQTTENWPYVIGYAVGMGLGMYLIPVIVMYTSKSAKAGWITFIVVAAATIRATSMSV